MPFAGDQAVYHFPKVSLTFQVSPGGLYAFIVFTFLLLAHKDSYFIPVFQTGFVLLPFCPLPPAPPSVKHDFKMR